MASDLPLFSSPLLSLLLLSLLLMLSTHGIGDKPPLPRFSVSWPDDKSTFRAGDAVMTKIKPWDDSAEDMNASYDKYIKDFSLEVRGKKGNSSFISGVYSYTEGDPVYWNITFIPIMVGEFTLVVTEEHSGVSDTTLHFNVLPGSTHPSTCIPWWMNDVNEFIAGNKATVTIALRDAFGNNSTLAHDGHSDTTFTVTICHENGSVLNIPELSYSKHDNTGHIDVEFILSSSGSFLLHVLGNNMMLRGPPLPFVVKPGPLDVVNCIGKWKYEINSLQIFSQLEFLIYQRDRFGNLVSGLYSFDAQVIKKDTNLSIPVADMLFSEIEPGIVLLSFVVSEPGDFSLVISDGATNQNISSTPHDFVVFVGYCDGSNSMVNGSGIVASTVGQLSYFTVYVEDMYHNPSPIELNRLHVNIARKSDSVTVDTNIFSLNDGHEPASSSINHVNNTQAESTFHTSAFNITFQPEKAGSYEIWVLCGNIMLNNGQPFPMTVFSGMVDKSASRVVHFAPKVKRLVKNEIYVELVDSFGNPVPSNEAKLGFKFDGDSGLSFLRWKFVNKVGGLYSGYYLAREVGTYKVCVLFEDMNLSPCPFEVSMYPREYFPEVHDDSVSVWEDGSVAFDVLHNDYYAGNASIISSSMPVHGSLLRYGNMFRYTPYKGTSGNDSFWYTISDIHNNLASGSVHIAVLSLPPQFVSLPDYLVAMEDMISPQFGGFQGFLIRYSDALEVISITIRAQSGTVMLAAMPFDLWQPGNNLSISNGGREGRDVHLSGNVHIINHALQFIQYLGVENFYGSDILSLYATNINGMQDAHVPINVEPVNDPPFVHVPRFILLESKEPEEGILIFDRQHDLFEFSIGDPDFVNFPGNKSYFVVTLSMEVSNGMLICRLPVGLLNTVELKIKNAYHWQHLQSFVTISQNFVAKGKGIRIRGTIEDCNNAMQGLLYQDAEQGAVLTINVNDMGNYGCNSGVLERTVLPLSADAEIHLIKRKPIGSLEAHVLGLAIIMEFVLMLLLGGILVLFICKCIYALQKERRRSAIDRKKNEVASVSPVEPNLLSSCPEALSPMGESSDFRKRSNRSFKCKSRQ